MMTPTQTKNPSELTRQESRAANEGMTDVPPPQPPEVPTPPGNVTKTRTALEGVLEAQNLGLRAYATALASAPEGPFTNLLETLQADLKADALGVRNLLAQLHDQSTPEPSGMLEALAGGVQRVAAMFGKSSTLGALALGESAMQHYMEELSNGPQLLPMAREALRNTFVPASVHRCEKLRDAA